MTYEEAHTWIENKQRMMTKNRWAFQSIDVEVNGKAIDALEKQIPKKPILHHIYENGNDYSYYECPNRCTVFDLVNSNDKFCRKCGQSLDWSNEE